MLTLGARKLNYVSQIYLFSKTNTRLLHRMKKINTPAEGSGISMLKHYRTAENGQPYKWVFFCVGVMYSGEYDACDVTLSVYQGRIQTVATVAYATVRFSLRSVYFSRLYLS
jgi:hypothetical protein